MSVASTAVHRSVGMLFPRHDRDSYDRDRDGYPHRREWRDEGWADDRDRDRYGVGGW